MGLTQILGRQIVEQPPTVPQHSTSAASRGCRRRAAAYFRRLRYFRRFSPHLRRSVARVRPRAAARRPPRTRGGARRPRAGRRSHAVTASATMAGFSQIFSSRRSQILFSSSRPAGRRQCAAIGSRRSTRCVRTRTPLPTTPAAGVAGICRMLGEDGSTTNGRRRPPAGFVQ